MERADGLFQNTGVLWTARRGDPYGEATLQTFRKLGVPHEVLSADDVRRRYPALHFEEEIIGILEPESGALLANRAVAAVAREAARIGVEVVEGAAHPFPEEGRLAQIAIQGGRTIAAETFIFACGPWLPKLFPQAVGRRIRVTRQPIFYFDAPGIEMPVWIDFTDPRGAYTIPALAGKSFKLALDQHGPPFDPDNGSRSVTAEETAAAREFLGERFPALHHAPVLETEVCQYESTSSGDFLIDRHPSMANVWLVGGGSGHGFKHGPAVGEYAASLIGGGESDPRFSWASKLEVAARRVF